MANHDITVHSDPKNARLSIVLSVGGVITILTAGALYGSMTNDLDHVKRNQTHLADEIAKRATTQEFDRLRDDMREIKAGVNRLNDYLYERAAARKE
ncbi:MAG: hypothetical protein MUF30_11815 [Burkholderiales bacterium]|nr:hypothetical protein [Burkholderiales bacterium]